MTGFGCRAPVTGERQNFLRYTARFEDCGETTRIRIEQRVELRREHARQLHTLAGLAGQSRLSDALQRGVADMMRTVLQRARARIEK